MWNYSEVRKLLPSATFVTLLRDPVDCWESNYVYMGLQNAFKMDINEFAASERVKRNYKLERKINLLTKARPETVRRESAIIDKVRKVSPLYLLQE